MIPAAPMPCPNVIITLRGRLKRNEGPPQEKNAFSLHQAICEEGKVSYHENMSLSVTVSSIRQPAESFALWSTFGL